LRLFTGFSYFICRMGGRENKSPHPADFHPCGVSLPLKIAVYCPSLASARVGESILRKMT
ncbi:MAG: hypothetical protein CMF83_00845, partial [Candidatus Marinimicrobia bacterium]|nr:hypothetical protein [Candidatus Neomarinimicrobiota bacterium]